MRRPSARLAWAVWAGLCLLPVLACNFGRATPEAAPTPAATPTLVPVPYDCDVEAAPTEADQLHAADFRTQLFDDNGWRKQITTYADHVTVIWRDPDTGGLAVVQYLMFGCPYTSANVLDMYRDAVFLQSVWSDYDDVQVLAQCAAGNTALHTFSGDYDQLNYQMYFWIVEESGTRLLTVALVLPTSRPTTLGHYAEALFPELSACPAE